MKTLFFILLVLASGVAAQTKTSANIAHQWINETQTAVATVGAQGSLASKYYSLVGLAMHQAIAAGGAPSAALAAFAAHTVLAGAFPWFQGKYDMMIAKQLSAVSAQDKKKAADIAVPIAVKLLRERTGDESTRWAMFKPAAPGTLYAYQYAPNQMMSLFPQLSQATPNLLTTKESEEIAFNKDASKGPVFKPSMDGYKDTFTLGAKDSKQRTQYDTDSAFFWAAGSNTSSIPGYWLTIAREVLPDMSLEETALFYARAGAAAYDAAITSWKIKHSSLAWRPITAFRSGFPGFEAVPSWEPLLPTPPHPEYPSGHQANVGAILEVLLRTTGRDEVSFTIKSESAPWLTRTYKSLTSAAKEVGDSRSYAGVHFRPANKDGLKLGRLVGAKVFDRIKPTQGSRQSAKVTNEAGKADKQGRRLKA